MVEHDLDKLEFFNESCFKYSMMLQESIGNDAIKQD